MFDGLNMQLFNFIAVCVAGGLFLLLLIYIGFLNYRVVKLQKKYAFFMQDEISQSLEKSFMRM